MIEFILIYISLCIIISVVSYLSEGFKGTAELNMICTLCLICVVLIPLSKAIPEIINDAKLFDIDTDTSKSEYGYEQFQENICQNIEESVKELIENEYNIQADVTASVNFEDMSSIKLEELEIVTSGDTDNARILKLVKNIYFCEVKIIEKP